jgi:aromatic ring-opening dioxygenase catalytic subunit (LigB family)
MTTIKQHAAALMPVIFVPHGGGPMPLMDDSSHRELISFLKSAAVDFPRPKTILVITAHWEEDLVTVSSGAAPGMLYDYYGFPPETYRYAYPAAGDTELAQRIFNLFINAGIRSRLDSNRRFDHGTFVPLMLMYPAADIPVVQLSLMKSLDPSDHIALGEALASLRTEGVLILGSGMSFHNMQAFFNGSAAITAKSEGFDAWLTDSLTNPTLSRNEQSIRLIHWEEAPDARFCHPREEHLLPLHVCFGAGSVASSAATKVFTGHLFNTRISAFLWS